MKGDERRSAVEDVELHWPEEFAGREMVFRRERARLLSDGFPNDPTSYPTSPLPDSDPASAEFKRLPLSRRSERRFSSAFLHL
jgi:hypothetical protein